MGTSIYPLTEQKAKQLLTPFIQVVEYSTNFTKPLNQDGYHWYFEHKNGCTFTMGWDCIHDSVYVVENERNEEVICQGLKDFINFIQLPF